MTHPNAERIQAEYRAFSDGDFGAIRRLLAPDAVWHVGGRGNSSGDKLGRDQIIEFLEGVFQRTQADFMIEVHDVLANDRHTVVLAHITAHRDDVTYTADEVHVFNVGEDGLVTEAWGFTGDPEGQGSFWF
ncbi:MAG TPA: nuclear transport factor 2 family protein [Acidimicrobiia bacterium]|jgi:hypothetical protein|nr:nuclear transport factor 2 family protein [Acidimicrobiia bacterium]